jgi:hypothetical protein
MWGWVSHTRTSAFEFRDLSPVSGDEPAIVRPRWLRGGPKVREPAHARACGSATERSGLGAWIPSEAVHGDGCGWARGCDQREPLTPSRRPTIMTVGCRMRPRIVLVAIAMLALTACTSGTSTIDDGSAKGMVTGRVMAGPTCPVERPGAPCPSRPVVAVVQGRRAGRMVASARLGSDGTYRLELPGGTYMIVVVTANPFPRCAARTVTVTVSQTTDSDIACDTGIR